MALSIRPQKAVFIDKDGTLIENVPYNVDPERVRLMPGVVAGMALLRQAGYRIFIVSNQPGVARGFFSQEDLDGVEYRVRQLLFQHRIPIDGFFFCPHHPDGTVPEYSLECRCRKPQPGMIQLAASLYSVDLSRSWLIGDILDDVEAGHRAGCRSILIDNGNETEWHYSIFRVPDYVAQTVDEAAALILA